MQQGLAARAWQRSRAWQRGPAISPGLQTPRGIFAHPPQLRRGQHGRQGQRFRSGWLAASAHAEACRHTTLYAWCGSCRVSGNGSILHHHLHWPSRLNAFQTFATQLRVRSQPAHARSMWGKKKEKLLGLFARLAARVLTSPPAIKAATLPGAHFVCIPFSECVQTEHTHRCVRCCT